MNKEEIEMLKNFINLGISESPSEDIIKYGYLDEKVFNYINQLETNRDEAIEYLKKYKEDMFKKTNSHKTYLKYVTPCIKAIEILERGKDEKRRNI